MGLGCLAGVAGINRAADYLKAYPKQLAIFNRYRTLFFEFSR